MASNSEWKEDNQLENDLRKYVSQNFKRSEILDFVQRDFPEYTWSTATLDRRLRHFGIYYINYDTPVAAVSDAVQKELEGPGKLLGYRAMNQKLRTEHDVQVPRHLVYNVMAELDPEGLEARNLQRKKKKVKDHFTSEGPLWVVSLDGHDKLCGYQNSTFPLGVYAGIDTFSRKILLLFECYSNSNPLVIGKMYLRYLFESEMLPRNLRVDRGTETGKMATIHVFLLNQHGIMDDPTDSIIYGPSTSNKIERWWRELHERLEKFFKEQLVALLRGREYDPHVALHRQLLAYVFIPIVQRECDIFVKYWNCHRIRGQDKLEIPAAVPDHIFSFPEQYGGTNMRIPLSNDQLREVAEVSGVMDEDVLDFIDPRVKRECLQLLPKPEKVESKNAIEAFRFLKRNITSPINQCVLLLFFMRVVIVIRGDW